MKSPTHEISSYNVTMIEEDHQFEGSEDGQVFVPHTYIEESPEASYISPSELTDPSRYSTSDMDEDPRWSFVITSIQRPSQTLPPPVSVTSNQEIPDEKQHTEDRKKLIAFLENKKRPRQPVDWDPFIPIIARQLGDSTATQFKKIVAKYNTPRQNDTLEGNEASHSAHRTRKKNSSFL